jgi:gentisate 1,2-dioxygenase
MRRTLAPGTGRTLPHRHLDGNERFEMLDGVAKGTVDGQSRILRAGDVLEVPAGSSHVHPHTDTSATATIEHTIEPRAGFAEVYFTTWLTRLPEGRVDRQEEPTMMQIMGMIKVSDGETWVAGPPVWLQKAMAAVLGSIAERTGRGAIWP